MTCSLSFGYQQIIHRVSTNDDGYGYGEVNTTNGIYDLLYEKKNNHAALAQAFTYISFRYSALNYQTLVSVLSALIIHDIMLNLIQ